MDLFIKAVGNTMMKIFLGVFAVFILMASPVYAAVCYSKQEAEAEQGIRIHSELMVIGLNCQHMAKANGQNLYLVYRKFTQQYAELFATYERILMQHMARNGDKNPEATLNTLRTDFANKISNDAAKMRPDIFCRSYSPRVEKASKLNYEGVRRWAATIFPSHPVSKPVCGASG